MKIKRISGAVYGLYKTYLKFYTIKYDQNIEYVFVESYKNDSGNYTIVAEIKDSFGKRFKLEAAELVGKREDILSKFCIDDIVNIIGLVSTEKEAIVSKNETVSQKYFSLLAMIFGAVLIASNIASSKLAYIFGTTITGGTIPYAFTYSLGDIITEVYGFKKTRQLIWGAIISSIFVIIFVIISIILPPAPSWHNQAQYELILGTTTRVIAASLISYWCSEFSNAYIIARLKIMCFGQYLWVRIMLSSLISITVDTLLFTTMAYFGELSIKEILNLMFISYTTGLGWEIVVIPVAIYVINFLKKIEDLDIFDINTNFSPFSLDVSYSEINNAKIKMDR